MLFILILIVYYFIHHTQPKNRMRGYYGMSGRTSFYSTTDRKYNTHKWEHPQKVLTAREWPVAWIGIDGEEAVTKEPSR